MGLQRLPFEEMSGRRKPMVYKKRQNSDRQARPCLKNSGRPCVLSEDRKGQILMARLIRKASGCLRLSNDLEERQGAH